MKNIIYLEQHRRLREETHVQHGSNISEIHLSSIALFLNKEHLHNALQYLKGRILVQKNKSGDYSVHLEVREGDLSSLRLTLIRAKIIPETDADREYESMMSDFLNQNLDLDTMKKLMSNEKKTIQIYQGELSPSQHFRLLALGAIR